MIVAGKRQSQKAKVSPIGVRPSKAGYGPAIYEFGKIALKSFGYYKDIEKYLPDKYIDKYTYKPHKRVAGYLAKTLQQKKKFRYASRNKFYEEYPGKYWRSNWNSSK